MKRIKNGKLEEIQPFDDAPEDFAFFVRDRWLPRIRTDEQVTPKHRIPPFHTRGHSLVVHLEWDAIKALAEVFPDLPQQPEVDGAPRAAALDGPDPSFRQPKQKPPVEADTYEHAYLRWRDVWAREAYIHASRPLAHTRKQSAALNILTTASEIRSAIETGRAEKAAALGMVLAFEAIAGGYLLDAESKIEVGAALQKAKDIAFSKGAGRSKSDLNRAAEMCVHRAEELWRIDPGMRIGKVKEICREMLRIEVDELRLPRLETPPTEDTIAKWLNEAEKAGRLAVPPEARKGGRPKSEK